MSRHANYQNIDHELKLKFEMINELTLIRDLTLLREVVEGRHSAITIEEAVAAVPGELNFPNFS